MAATEMGVLAVMGMAVTEMVGKRRPIAAAPTSVAVAGPAAEATPAAGPAVVIPVAAGAVVIPVATAAGPTSAAVTGAVAATRVVEIVAAAGRSRLCKH